MERNHQPFKSHLSIIGLMLLATVLVLFLIKFDQVMDIVKAVLTASLPFLLGFIIAYILNILVKHYEKIFPKKNPWQKKSSRGISVILAIGTVISLFTLIAFLAIPQLIHSLAILIQSMPSVYQVATVKTDEYLTHWLPSYQKLLSDNLNQALLNYNIKSIANTFILQLISFLQEVVRLIFNFALALIFAVFVLSNKERLTRQITNLSKAFLCEKTYKHLHYVTKISNETLSSFIVGQFLDASILGILVTLGLFIFGVSYPVTIGCTIGLLSLIPLLGAYLGGLMGIIILLPTGISQSVIFVLVLIVIQQIESNLIYPRVVGGSIGLPGIWTFTAITFGGFLYGILGMIISVPLAAILYKLLRQEVRERLKEKNL